MTKKIYTFIFVICVITALGITGFLGHHFLNDRQSAREYDTYKENVSPAPLPNSAEAGPKSESTSGQEDSGQKKSPESPAGQETHESPWPEPPTVNWDSFEDRVLAWIEVPAVGIGYPVVQAEDNAYYLRHTPGGEYRFAGSIFLDHENEPDFLDLNTIIYGHNMNDGSMFGRLKEMGKQSVYETYPYFWICTRTKNMLYQIISVHPAQTEGDTYTLFDAHTTSQSPDFIEWVQGEVNKSEVTATMPQNDKGRVVTLSTCISGNTRRVVQGVLVAELATKD